MPVINIIRFFSKTHCDRDEKVKGVRITAIEFEKRPGAKPKVIRVVFGKENT